MYHVAVRRDFIARHFLIGGNWGAENQLHSHHYIVELDLAGDRLDAHNYLVDIVAIENQLDQTVSRFRDSVLNDQPEFENQNPSVELFSQILCRHLIKNLSAENIRGCTVRLWENNIAWASFEMEL